MSTKKFRKQSREESQTKIEDEAIAPYVIYFDGFTYTLVKPKDNTMDENVGYYSNLANCLKATAKLLVQESKTTTISDFIHRYNEVMNSLNAKFNI